MLCFCDDYGKTETPMVFDLGKPCACAAVFCVIGLFVPKQVWKGILSKVSRTVPKGVH